MNRTVFTESSSNFTKYAMWLAAIIILAVMVGISWTLAQNGSSTAVLPEAAVPQASTNVEVAAQPQTITGPRAPDLYSAQLELLRQRALIAANRDGATAYSVWLESLAGAGREAYVNNSLPTTANGYTVYLDNLRRLGQAVHSENNVTADPNEFSEWLDQLRRLSQ